MRTVLLLVVGAMVTIIVGNRQQRDSQLRLEIKTAISGECSTTLFFKEQDWLEEPS